MKIIIPEHQSEKNHNVWSESTLQFTLKYLWFFFGFILSLYLLFYIIALSAMYMISIENEQKLFWDIFAFSDEFIIELPDDLKERYSHVTYPIYITEEIEEPNAFAALGWNIYITQSLIDLVEHPEALDFIIGHEIAHIENRDVLRSLVSELPIQLGLSLLGFSEANILFQHTLSNPHSKYQETRADEGGIDFAYQMNGSIGCSLEFFEQKNSLEENIAEIFSTHPVTHFRIERAQEYVEEKGYEVWVCGE